MSDEINDGGPAFPVPSYVNADGETWESKPQGMTLRDWFAGQALAGMDIAGCTDYPEIAGEAYLIADAMLRERESK